MLRAGLQRQGLGRALMTKMIRYLRGRGTATLSGECRNAEPWHGRARLGPGLHAAAQ